MKYSELKDKAVISVEGARKVGTIDDVLVDPSGWHIAAVLIKAAAGGPGYLVSAEHILGIGPDAVTVPSTDALQPLDRARTSANLPSLNAMMDRKVVTEGGALLGTISAVYLDAASREVQAFEYVSGAFAGLLHRQRTLAPEMVVDVGPDMVTVREGARPSREAGA